MAFARPTLADLVTRIQADFTSRLGLGGTAVLRRSMVYVLSRVLAGAAHMLHGHLDWLSKQLFPDTSDLDLLIRQAGLYGITRNPATAAAAMLTAPSYTLDADFIPDGAIYVRAADGARYVVSNPGGFGETLPGAQVPIIALTPGAASSLVPGQQLTMESPVFGFNASTTVASVTTDGADVESVDSLRARLKARLNEAPQGGNDSDYLAWALGIPGITRAWVTRAGMGPGTVVVRFARDNDASPIPDAGEVAALQAVLNAKAPAHATPYAIAPTAAPTAFSLAVVPNTAAVKTAVQAELADLFTRKGKPGGTMLISEIRTTIGNTPGLTDYTMTTPSADLTFTANQLPTVGTVTFV